MCRDATHYGQRLLKEISDGCKTVMEKHFIYWPLKSWENSPNEQPAILCEQPVCVNGVAGQMQFDKSHREFFLKFPSQHLTIVTAPPGSGKSTALKNAVEEWTAKKILYIVFNKSNQNFMRNELGNNADCRTMDSLCYEACGFPSDFDSNFSDQSLIHRYWPETSKDIRKYCLKL